MQQYIHVLAKEYLLLHKPDYHDFQSYMARLTSDGARPNVDYRKSKLIRTNRTDLKQTHKHIIRLLMESFTLKLLMMSSRFLKRCLFTCFVPMSAGLMSVGM